MGSRMQLVLTLQPGVAKPKGTGTGRGPSVFCINAFGLIFCKEWSIIGVPVVTLTRFRKTPKHLKLKKFRVYTVNKKCVKAKIVFASMTMQHGWLKGMKSGSPNLHQDSCAASAAAAALPVLASPRCCWASGCSNKTAQTVAVACSPCIHPTLYCRLHECICIFG